MREVLQGWKTIAGFLNRDERTVRRWEKQYGLPIRRLTNDRKSMVYALPSELEMWLLGRGSKTDRPLQNPSPAESNRVSEADGKSGIVPSTKVSASTQGGVRSIGHLILLAILGLGTAVLASRLHHSTTANMKVISETREVSISSADPDESVSEGELLLDRRTPKSMMRAVEILTRRTQQAPADAPAYASLAKALCLIREYSTIPSSKAFPLAEDAANQALRLDPKNSDAHAALGFVDFFWKWDGVTAEHHFAQALMLAPASATAHQWYGSMLLHQGRKEEALKQLNQAEHLAPASTAIASTRAMALSLSGQRDAATNILRKLEMDAPEALPPHRTAAYLSMQEPVDIQAFLNETERFNQLREDKEAVAEILHARTIFKAEGKVAMFQFLLSKERMRGKDRRRPSFREAELEALLGREQAAISHAALAVRNHEEGALALSINPAFQHLRGQGKLDEPLRILQSPTPNLKWKD